MECVENPLQRFLFFWFLFLPFGCHLLISPAPDGSAEFPKSLAKMEGKQDGTAIICVVNLLGEVARL